MVLYSSKQKGSLCSVKRTSYTAEKKWSEVCKTIQINKI